MHPVVVALLALVAVFVSSCPNQEYIGFVPVRNLKARLSANFKEMAAAKQANLLTDQRADKPLNWLESGVVYQIYPRSFQDSNDDGIGDIRGIISRLDHFVEMGVNIVWLSPVFKSPMADLGYDISDFTDIDPIFGTLDDFTALTAAAAAKNIKILLDIVPNHSSDEHQWFINSVNRVDPYTDYYVWRDGPSSTQPPNNWLSVFGGSAWTYNEIRGQWYLHQFAAKQPDLNFLNPAIHEELKTTLRFWLDRGADGFRVDAVPHLYEDERFLDEPLSNDPNADPDQYGYLDHVYTWNRDETYDVIAEMRTVLQEYEDRDGKHRAMLTEAYVPLADVIRYYGNETNQLADFPFNFNLIQGIGQGFTGTQLVAAVRTFLDAVPTWAWPNWVLGNHDQRRVATRFGAGLVDAMAMVQLLLPGTPVVYNGDEVGMEDTFLTYEQTQDPQGCNMGPDRYANHSRDPARTPMQWDDTFNAGFSAAAETWLPLNENYPQINVKLQKQTLNSHFNVYRTLIALRQEPAIRYGETDFPLVDDAIFSLTRIRQGSTSYLVVMNVGASEQIVSFESVSNIPSEATELIRSVQSANPATQPGLKVPTNKIPIGSNEGLVLSFLAA
jgi:alpha-glucosidase